MRSTDGPKVSLSAARLAVFLALSYVAALAASLGFLRAGTPLDEISYSTAVYDRNGTLLRLTLSTDEKFRMKAELSSLPASMREAILLKEDRSFFFHPGVNPAALAGAFWHSVVLRDYRAGGSTLTMQLARLLYKLDTDTAFGKLHQIVAAFALELAYTKGRILEAYVSLVPCGGNVEGFPAASLIYFKKPLSSLSLSEILLLCSIPQRPGDRGPGSGSSAILSARDMLYTLWVSRHPEDAALSIQFEMPERLAASLPFEAPHAVDSLLRRHPGQTRVDSTIDVRLQKTLERIVCGYTQRNRVVGIRNASVLLVRRQGMEELAEVGSAGFFDERIEGQVNGTEAKRSPGSALKPFLYALAMDQSLIHPMTMLKDAPIHFSGYNPDNFDDDFVGPITAKDALIKSRNVPAVSLSQRVKNPDIYDFLVRAGVRGLRPKEDYGVSLILGTAEVTMKELATLYGTLANGGTLTPLVDSLGASAAPRDPPRLLSPEAAFLTTQILEEKPRPDEIPVETLRGASRPCAWKTGTSIGFRDAWSVGIFDSFILCVWVGNFDGSGNPGFVGLAAAAPLMFEIVDAIRASGLEADYSGDWRPAVPVDIVRTKVCSVSGMIPNPLCPSTVETWFIPGKSPIDVCDIHQEVYIDVKTGLRRSAPHEGATRGEVYEIWPSDVLALFEKAGFPRRRPPPFAPDEDLTVRSQSGRSPQIVSPLPRGEYAIRLSSLSTEEIPLIAVVPSDAAVVFWFLNESYLGQSARGRAFFWKPLPGAYVLRATDDQGRSGSCRFSVVLRQ